MMKRQTVENGLIVGEIVQCVSEHCSPIEVEILEINEVREDDRIKNVYLFRETHSKENTGMVGVGTLLPFKAGRYQLEANLTKFYGPRTGYTCQQDAVSSLKN